MSRKISNQRFLLKIYCAILPLKVNCLSNEEVQEANISVSGLDLEGMSGAEFFKPVSEEFFKILHQPTEVLSNFPSDRDPDDLYSALEIERRLNQLTRFRLGPSGVPNDARVWWETK
jgi:hypothetical protein